MSPDSPPDHDASQSTPARRLLQLPQEVARGALLWLKTNRLRASLVLGVGGISLAAVVAAWLTIDAQRSGGDEPALEQVLLALDEGRYAEARDLAERLQSEGALRVDELGGPVFALGAAAAYEADDTWSTDKTRLYLLAARYLEEARDRGFPPDRRGEGLYLLGRSLYFSGQIPDAKTALLGALKTYPRKKTEIHGLLAGAYLKDANPKPAKALAENALYLSDKQLSAAARHDGLLQRAQILLRQGKMDECARALDAIPAEARNLAEATILRGRVLIHEGRALKNKPGATTDDDLAAKEKFRTAIRTLRKAQGHDTFQTHATRKAVYLIGTCFLELGDYRAGLAQFAWICKFNVDTPEALAASFEAAELSRRLGQEAEALAAYRRTLGAITDPEHFSNPYLSLDELRRRMLAAYKHYLDTRHFEIVPQLSQRFYPLFSRARTLQLLAEAHAAWGGAILASAEELPADEAAKMQRLGRTQLRRAGRVYLRLAKIEIATRKYSDWLWASADGYLEGHDYRNTIRVLQEYVKNEPSRRRPLALLRLGEAQLALDKVDDAIGALRDCMEFHSRDAASYRARLLASRAYLEKGDPKQSAKLLLENLHSDGLTPASKEWRESLFALGKLLHMEGRYPEAARRLEEMTERYPDSTEAVLAQYFLADSYRQAARIDREKLEKDLKGSARATRSSPIDALLEKALDEYQQVQETLRRRQDRHELAPVEATALRNCDFAVGDVLFDLGRYQAALRAYSSATNRYQDKPEVLEAYVQIAGAYRRLDKPAEARSALAQAKVILGRMQPETQFAQTTNYTRQQWSDRLEWLATL